MTTNRLIVLSLLWLGVGASASALPQITIGQGSAWEDAFELGVNGWTTDGALWQLATPNQTFLSGAFSGTLAWVTGPTVNYPNGADTSVYSPMLDFGALTHDPLIRIRINHATEFFYDGFRLEMDLGQGFATVGQPGPGWYDSSLSPSGIGGVGFSGGSGGWVDVSHALVGSAGHAAVTLRIRFGSDGTVNGEGVAFDDVRIVPTDVACPGTATTAGDDLVQQLSINTELQGPGFIHDVFPGASVGSTTLSPGGTFAGRTLYPVGEIFLTGAPPIPLLAGLCISSGPNAFLIEPGGVVLMAPGYAYAFQYPGGLAGTSVFLQTIAIGPVAANGVFASTDAREIRLQ